MKLLSVREPKVLEINCCLLKVLSYQQLTSLLKANLLDLINASILRATKMICPENTQNDQLFSWIILSHALNFVDQVFRELLMVLKLKENNQKLIIIHDEIWL